MGSARAAIDAALAEPTERFARAMQKAAGENGSVSLIGPHGTGVTFHGDGRVGRYAASGGEGAQDAPETREAFPDAPQQTAPEKDYSDAMGAAARDQLKGFVSRIERLEEEKAGLAADLKEVYAEAKSFGYDTKVLRKVIAIRKQDRHEREEQEALLDLYLGAVGE